MSNPKNNLKKLRLENKMTGVQIAEAVNITAQYYYELERGDKRLNEDLIRKFAEFYGVTTDYILGIETPDKSAKEGNVEDNPLGLMSNTKTKGLNLKMLKKLISEAVNEVLEEREKKKNNEP